MSMGAAQATQSRERDLTGNSTSGTSGRSPATEVAAWLRGAGVDDVRELATVAYAALTGTDPASDPVAPRELVPGFPTLVDAALMRALTAPPEGRPTSQALLALLEKTPAASWPASMRHNADVEYRDPAVDDAYPQTNVAERPEPVEVTDLDDGPAPADEAWPALRIDALGRPGGGHAIPVFEPLEGAGELPVSTANPTRRSRHSESVNLPYGDDPWEQRLLALALVIAAIVAVALVLVSR